jgi:LysR family hydrogen peroxide-inducible transcriptional activator
MEIHQLRYFAKVAELSNFTLAAKACHVSQPSLSLQIAKLERQLGQPLLERQARGARLTAAGKRFKERVDQILHLLDDAVASVQDEADAGRLVIAAIPTIAPYLLPRILARFARDYPRVQIEVIEETTENLVKLCIEGEADLAILALPIASSLLELTTLFEEELQVILPRNHQLAAKKKLTLHDLAEQPFVLLHEAHCLTDQTRGFCSRHLIAPIATARTHQLATVQELVGLGHGISLIPTMAAKQDRHPDRVYRNIQGNAPSRTIAMGWHRHRYQSPLFLTFVEFLKRACRKTHTDGRDTGSS